MDEERNNSPSASAWYRYEACPGSWRLEQEARALGQVAHAAPSPEAERGRRIHAALAGEQVELSASEVETVRLLEERVAGEVKRIFGEAEPEVFNEVRIWWKI